MNRTASARTTESPVSEIVVSIPEQKLELFKNDRLLQSYSISTAKMVPVKSLAANVLHVAGMSYGRRSAQVVKLEQYSSAAGQQEKSGHPG